MSTKAEGDRAQMMKVLEINQQMRQYDLKRIKESEVEDLQNSVKSIKEDWADLRGFLQRQVNTLTEVKDRHDNEVTDYKNFCEFLEPKSLKDKLLNACNRLKVETERVSMPVKKLETDLDYVREKREQAKKELARVMLKNEDLRSRLNLPEDKKVSASVEVQGLREKMGEMQNRMLELERSNIDVGRNPATAMG